MKKEELKSVVSEEVVTAINGEIEKFEMDNFERFEIRKFTTDDMDKILYINQYDEVVLSDKPEIVVYCDGGYYNLINKDTNKTITSYHVHSDNPYKIIDKINDDLVEYLYDIFDVITDGIEHIEIECEVENGVLLTKKELI